ncbi:MAG: hypothetical protein IIX57_04545 [Lachnospiraceae bacterium]|nr:hypothetical protein [Lachnospiraceae bacterium]
MAIEPGTTLYRYTVRGCKFHVSKGVVNICSGRKRVVLSDGDLRHRSVRCPRPEDLGVVRNNGFVVWLDDRDDELAKQIFIDFENHKINQLQKMIDSKREIVEMLTRLDTED